MSLPPKSPRRFRFPLRFLLTLPLWLLIAGAYFQTFAEHRDSRLHPIPGELIDVGLYQLHIDCTGSGSPAVILDSGLGDTYVSWSKVQPPIAQFTRVCSYDRAGLGYSYYSHHPSTSRDFAQELHILLHNAGIAPPYVLVGHSMAGFDVRLYASLYPAEVAGMVLVDSSHPDQQKRLPPALNDLDKTWVREQEFLTFLMPFGIPRLMGFCGQDAALRAAECNFHTEKEALAELKAFPESARQAATTGSLGDLPLAVLTSDPTRPEPDLPEDLVEPMHHAWTQMQDELSQLSTHSTHVIAKNSGHYIQQDRPDVVVEAVRQVVEQARQSRSMPSSLR
jgi:pimeloyl-ACP methyl ester carboxylesterase